MDNNSNDNQTMLKTIMFGGFDKKEVLTYIDSLRETNAEKINQLNNQLSEMSTARTSLEENISSFEQTMSNLERNISENNTIIKELNEEVLFLKSDIEIKIKVINDAENELDNQKAENRTLEFNANSYEYKAQRYDEISAQIGEILLSAKQSANIVIKAAEENASELMDHAQAVSRKTTKELTGLKSEIGAIKKNIEEMLGSLTGHLDSLTTTIDLAFIHDTDSITPHDSRLCPEQHKDPIIEPHEETDDSQAADASVGVKNDLPWFFNGTKTVKNSD